MKDFLEKLASKNPTPGGGAAAAVVGAMAAALAEMVCGLTKDDEVKRLAPSLQKYREELLRLADEDVAAFDAVMAAYKSKNKTEIRKALLGATAVPEETMRLSKEVEELAKVVARKGSKNAVSDAKSAIYLAQAAQKSALENVRINRESLKKL